MGLHPDINQGGGHIHTQGGVLLPRIQLNTSFILIKPSSKTVGKLSSAHSLIRPWSGGVPKSTFDFLFEESLYFAIAESCLLSLLNLICSFFVKNYININI